MTTLPQTRGRVSRTLSLIAALLLALPAYGVRAAGNPNPGNPNPGNPNPGVLPPNSHPHGQTYGEWNAQWWQWVFSVPASQNQALQSGAVDCSVGQSGHVWFLAGSFSPGRITRSCTVPTGTLLFVPLLNAWADNVCNTPPLTVDQLRALAASFVLPPTELHASVDGQSLSNLDAYRAVSPVFSYTLPPAPDNVLEAVFGVALPGSCWPSLSVTPAVADGFYVMLAPLSAGTHVLTVGGTAPGSTTALDVTYHLSVQAH